MEIRVLKYFLAIAREQSISKAAEYLHVSQPALSKQIRELEDHLGTTLFIRGSRKITLTDDGLLLRRRAEQIVELSDRTEMLNRTLYQGKIKKNCKIKKPMDGALCRIQLHNVPSFIWLYRSYGL